VPLFLVTAQFVSGTAEKTFLIGMGKNVKQEQASCKPESMNTFSLCFKSWTLEEEYRGYQFELVRYSMLGKMGTLSTISICILCLLLPNFIAYFMQIGTEKKPGTVERMIYSIPITTFTLYHQLRIQFWTPSGTGDRRTCDFFLVGLLLLYAHQDFLNAHFINDRFPEFEGCEIIRFRCPYSFSSSLFGARGVVFSYLNFPHPMDVVLESHSIDQQRTFLHACVWIRHLPR
jgi:hypothetical protein